MFRYSLRGFAIIFIGISISFAICFLPIQQYGFIVYTTVVVGILCGLCWTAANLIKRNEIAIAALFTVSTSLGAQFSLPSLAPHYGNFHTFIALCALLGFMPMLIAIPLTIHRRTGSLRRE